MVDARPENVAFVSEPIPQCKYFLASQCHPVVFDACADRDTTIYHVISTNGEAERDRLNFHYGEKHWQEVPSSGTVGIIAIVLCRMLGFRFQHIFGMDSCYSPGGDRHHAYPQALNDAEGAGEFVVAGRSFLCSAWQASQIGEFTDLLRYYGDEVCLDFHGDGAIAHLLKAGFAAEEGTAA
jgi:hypothetical protein